jgi:hypothetical protein
MHPDAVRSEEVSDTTGVRHRSARVGQCSATKPWTTRVVNWFALDVTDEGIFRFPEDIERGPTTYQEMKFVVLWECPSETWLFEVYAEAGFVTKDENEQAALGERVLRELRAEGLIDVVQPWSAEPSARSVLTDAEFDDLLRDRPLLGPETEAGREVFIRPTPLAEEWFMERGVTLRR